MSIRSLLAAAALVCAVTASADVTPSAIFSNNMVLQRDAPVKVWGTASPSEAVSVSFAGQTVKTTADAKGRWEVTLSPLAMSRTPAEMKLAGNNTVTLQNILVGDVWLCSGQSNMEMNFNWGVMDGNKFIEESSKYSTIRWIKVPRITADFPVDNVTVQNKQWTVCGAPAVKNFTVTGYFFARKLTQELNIPIGLIESAWSGCKIEPFMNDYSWDAPEFAAHKKNLLKFRSEYTGQDDLNRKKIAMVREYLDKVDKKMADGLSPVLNLQSIRMPGIGNITTQYNAMIAPLNRFAIKGVLWYQGCSNGGEGDIYFTKMKGLIEGWRKDWKNDFPFYIVQLAAFTAPTSDPAGGNGYAKIREAQRRTLTLPKTGMACAIDIGMPNDIHPKNKIDVGERLARWALHNDYGKKDVVVSGPLFKSMKVIDGKIRVDFDYADGLMTAVKTGYAAPVPNASLKPAHFAIAGADKKWHWADAVIDGNSVIVSSPEVPAPVAVRYAFRAYPDGVNLYNAAGLPMVPFRTDNW